jgi:trans-aconitate methyltransferase
LDISEFVSSLPEKVLTGDDISLPENVIRKIFRFGEVSNDDIFYHLGCGIGNTVRIAAEEFGVKRSIGIEKSVEIASVAKKKVRRLKNAQIIVDDIRNVSLSDATVVLFWFNDERIANQMTAKFKKETKDSIRILTILSPLGLIKPSKVNFPFFMTMKPFEFYKDLQEQIETIHGTRCLDFTGSWNIASRYVTEMDVVPGEYQRFVIMVQCMVIWINAWNMGIACESEIPPPVKAYIGILKEFFNLDLSSMIQ